MLSHYLRIIKIAIRLILGLFSRNRWQKLSTATISIAMSTTTIGIASVRGAISQQSAKKNDSEYINQLLPEARRIRKEYGIPLDLTLAIALFLNSYQHDCPISSTHTNERDRLISQLTHKRSV